MRLDERLGVYRVLVDGAGCCAAMRCRAREGASSCVLLAFLIAALFLGGCKGGKNVEPSLTSDGSDESAAISTEVYEARLRGAVERELESVSRREDPSAAKVSFVRPWYFKEYAMLPNEPDDFTLEFTERESRTAPLTADMSVAKVRFATRFHAKKEQARADENFLRDTGIETVTYELRNGRWYRVGSLYVAEKSEEFVDGIWQPILDLPARPTLEPEEPEGWLQKLKFWR